MRALIDSISHNNYRAFALVGLWEGIVLNHFVVKLPSSFDPYLAFGFRLFVDFLYTESLTRMTVIVLWTGLGMLFADISIELLGDRRFRRLWRRIRRSLFLPSFHELQNVRFSRVRFLEGASTASTTSRTTIRSPTLPPQSPLQPILRRSTRPLPGQFDQWSEVTTVITVDSEPPREEPHLLEPEPEDITPRGSPAPSSSALTYVDDIPIIPDPSEQPSHSQHRVLHEDLREYGSSSLTTPRSPLSPSSDPEDRPYIHSGLTTPPTPRYATFQDPSVPPIHIYDENRSQQSPQTNITDIPPIPIPPRLEGLDYMGGFTVPAPFADESDRPISYANPIPRSPGFIMPSESQIPDIPGEEASYRSKREEAEDDNRGVPDDSVMADPPPQYQEPIQLDPPTDPPAPDADAEEEPPLPHPAPGERNIPDTVSETGSMGESVISGRSRNAIIIRAENLRKEAKAMEKERDTIKNELKQAEADRRWLDAMKLEVDLEEAQEKAKQLHAKAAHRFWRAHNLKPEPHEIDVHRLSVQEAVMQVKRALRDAITSNSPQLRIITGKGKHSKDGIPALKLAIIRELQIRHITATPDFKNDGVLIVAFPAMSGGSNLGVADPSTS